MAPGLKKCVPGLNTFSGFNRASHLNTAVACLFMSEKRLANFYCVKVCHVKITFYIFSVHIIFYGTVECLGEETRSGQWSVVRACLCVPLIKNSLEPVVKWISSGITP